jgi:hypothetical protein
VSVYVVGLYGKLIPFFKGFKNIGSIKIDMLFKELPFHIKTGEGHGM